MKYIHLLLIVPFLALTACNATIGERMGTSLAVVRGFQSSDHPIPSEVFANAKGIAIIRENSAALVVGGLRDSAARALGGGGGGGVSRFVTSISSSSITASN